MPFCAGIHGGIGSPAAIKLVSKSDLLIVIGSSFSQYTQLPKKPMVQIDINMKNIAKKYPVEVGLLGNSAILIPKLTKKVQQKEKIEYLNELSKLKKDWNKQLEREIDSTLKPIRPPYIIKLLNHQVSSNAIFSIDVGENCWWFGRNFKMKKTQKMVMSGLLATMGFGFPGAMAASLAYPNRQIICITGDGGFTQIMGDFLTALKYKMPIKVFIFNNKSLGMIKQEQKVEGYISSETELYNFNFADYANNSGGLGIKVTEPNRLEESIVKALSSDKTTIVDIDTDPRRFF
ncbi:MAG: thiamine pyrophosphate-dependent enzyme [Candidatus Bathyarchaeota archaeon]